MGAHPVEVHVIPNPEEQRRGSGFPRLLLTERDEDPATGQIRQGDPEQPALWQETTDFITTYGGSTFRVRMPVSRLNNELPTLNFGGLTTPKKSSKW